MSGENDAKTIFQKIWDNDIQEPKIFQLENLGIMGLWSERPASRGHYLIVPKEAVDDISDLQPGRAGQLLEAATFIARHLRQKLPGIVRVEFDVIRLEVPHTHIHGVPQYNRSDSGALHAPDLAVRARDNMLPLEKREELALNSEQLAGLITTVEAA